MATWTWSYYDGVSAQINFGSNAVDKIGFYGWLTDVATSFGKKVYIGEYNDTMHLRAISGGTDDCIAPHLVGVKYTASGKCKLNHATEINLSATTANDAININFADAGMSYTENSIFYCHGAATTDHPGATGGGAADIVAYAAEAGAATWTKVDSSSTVLTLSTPSGASVNWHMCISASPVSVGAKDQYFTWRIQTDYY